MSGGLHLCRRRNKSFSFKIFQMSSYFWVGQGVMANIGRHWVWLLLCSYINIPERGSISLPSPLTNLQLNMQHEAAGKLFAVPKWKSPPTPKHLVLSQKAIFVGFSFLLFFQYCTPFIFFLCELNYSCRQVWFVVPPLLNIFNIFQECFDNLRTPL